LRSLKALNIFARFVSFMQSRVSGTIRQLRFKRALQKDKAGFESKKLTRQKFLQHRRTRVFIPHSYNLPMHLHILGICGTFMGGIAALAQAAGHRVTGCDANVYPPMSLQLEALGIELISGFDAGQLSLKPDVFVIGNALSRGNPLVEAILASGAAYTSGPQWLAENVLQGRHVLAVAGTHGKTTTSSMLAWILEHAGLKPGFLIGGVPQNFGVSARLGEGAAFVVEADEYDTAFFDKRSKFVHYRPRTAILNNLEFDHADIFENLAAIEKQFHHLVRTVPQAGVGRLVVNAEGEALERVLKAGMWSELVRFGLHAADYAMKSSAESFEVIVRGKPEAEVHWQLLGAHNQLNALAAIAAAAHLDVSATRAAAALAEFENVKRRLELRGEANGARVYDDFAHHPTAITASLQALRSKVGTEPIIAVFEPRSATMKLGTLAAQLPGSFEQADAVFCFTNSLGWDPKAVLAPLGAKATVESDLGALVEKVAAAAKAYRGKVHVLVMSNGGFGGIHAKLLEALK
jgi:UDP-N-acetylmuramate: L-alanyl-gamma-D-glutamyl-meso-diaminopimelate ligase